MRLIIATDPRTLLDVGVGFGKYGFLSREYLELWDGREKYTDWKRQIDGIEAHRDYITPVHRHIYNNIFLGDAVDVLSNRTEVYDLILLIDVLEHFDRQEGERLLRECERRARNVLISIPKEIGSQENAFGNPYETHRAQWRRSDFSRSAHRFFVRNQFSVIVYSGQDARVVQDRIKRHTVRKLMIPLLERAHLKGLAKRILGMRTR
jgi:SAM-dependent methyltransferase